VQQGGGFNTDTRLIRRHRKSGMSWEDWGTARPPVTMPLTILCWRIFLVRPLFFWPTSYLFNSCWSYHTSLPNGGMQIPIPKPNKPKAVTSLSIRPFPPHILFLMVFHKAPYCFLPYTISSQPIRPRATIVILPHLWMTLRSLCPAEILGWFAIYCNNTSILLPRTASSER
jgi:hypothetical protein